MSMMDRAATDFSDILDDCLTRIQSGKASVESCLREFPQHADALAIDLKLASQVQATLAPNGPTKSFATNSKIRLLNRLQASSRHAARQKPRPSSRRRRRWKPAYALVSIIFAIVLVSTSAGVAWASSSALPGDTLYGVKRGVEEARLALTLSSTGDAALLNAFTDERLEELETLLALGRDADAVTAIAAYEANLERLIDQVVEIAQADGEPSLDEIEGRLDHHAEVLERVMQKAPPQAQAALAGAKEKSQHGKAVVEYLRQGGDPSDLAPGQLKKATPQPGDDQDPEAQKKVKTPKIKDKDKTPGPPPWANPNGEDDLEIE